MKIEKLISSYLDSDLSRDEDKSLRDMINDDEFAKRKFESSVDIHLAMKEDAASVSTPDDLMRDTEDIIMMKILNQNPYQQTEKPKRKTPLFYYASAAAIVIMFGLIFRISDSNIFNNFINTDSELSYNQYIESLDPNTFSIDVPKFNSKEVDSEISSQNSNSESYSATTSNNDFNLIAVINSTDSAFDNQNLTLFENSLNIDDETLKNEIPALNVKPIDINNNKSEISNNSENNIFSANAGNIPFNGIMFLNNEIPQYSYFNIHSLARRSRIDVTSSVSNSFVDGGIASGTDESVVNYSQSIAYHSSDKLSFGLEFGYLNFNSTRNIPAGGGSSDFSEISVNSSIEVQDPTKSEDFIPAHLPVVVNNQLFWGSVFVSYDFLNYKDIVLEGRFGTGATSDGPLSYARVQAKYEIYNGIFLNFGSEGRLFIYNVNGNNLSASNLSFIYGIQFAFD